MLKAVKFSLCTLLLMSICVLGLYGGAFTAEIKRGGTVTVGIDAGPLGWDPHISLAFS